MRVLLNLARCRTGATGRRIEQDDEPEGSKAAGRATSTSAAAGSDFIQRGDNQIALMTVVDRSMRRM